MVLDDSQLFAHRVVIKLVAQHTVRQIDDKSKLRVEFGYLR